MNDHPLPALGPLLMRAVTTLGRRGEGGLGDSGVHARHAAPAIAPAFLARYRDFFGGFGSALPLGALYPLAQRAQLALMLESRFPYPVVGLVHVENEMARLGPLEPDAPWTLEVSCRTPEASSPDAARRLAFDVTLLQAGQPRATCRSLYQIRPGAGAIRGPRPTPAPADPPAGPGDTWRLEADAGRRYARLSGDYNPIHLWGLTARALGFERPIWHGMAAAARVQAGLERATGQDVTALSIAFKRPIALPATVDWRWEADSEAGGRYAVWSADGAVRHLAGTFRTAPR